jgi:hypothetical protein
MLTEAAGTSDVQSSTDGSLGYRASKENHKRKRGQIIKGSHAWYTPRVRVRGETRTRRARGDIPYKAKCRQVIIVGAPTRARTELSQNMMFVTRPLHKCSFLILDI